MSRSPNPPSSIGAGQQLEAETGSRFGSRAAIRVLWLIPDKPANVSVGRHRIADHLRRDGFDVTLRGMTPRSLVRSLREAESYDVVVGTTRAGAIGGVLVKLRGGIPLVVDHVDPIRQFETTHPRWLAFAVRHVEHLAFRIADHVLYVYDEEENRVRRWARSYSQTDLGVEYDWFADPSSETVQLARERLSAADAGGDGREKIAIYVGGLEPIYRIEELLAAAELLPEWSLVLLGTGMLEGSVERAASERENVHFLGEVPHEDVPGYLHAADVGVCLVDDPHTLKVLEYAAAGLPVVHTRGRAEDRFSEYVEFCEPQPTDIARAVRTSGERGASEAFREYVSGFDYGRVPAEYARVLATVV